MKKKIFIYFVIAITIINLTSLGVILYNNSKMSFYPIKVGEHQVFEQVKREVKLTPGQIKQFQKLRIAFHTKLDSLSAKVQKNNKLLAAEIRKENPDTTTVRSLVNNISKMQTVSKYLVIHHFFYIKKILTKKQEDKFFNIVLQRFLRKNQLPGSIASGRKKCPGNE